MPSPAPGWKHDVEKILDAHRRGLRGRPETTDLLSNVFLKHGAEVSAELCTYLEATLQGEPIKPTMMHGFSVSLPLAVMPVLARFGSTERLTNLVLSLANWKDPSQLQVWASEVGPTLEHCLHRFSDRFNPNTLATIQNYRALVRLNDGPFPIHFIESLDRLCRTAELVEFELFERTLNPIPSTGTAANVDSLLHQAGLPSHIGEALQMATEYLRTSGVFDPKTAADFLRAAIEEAHRSVVVRIAAARGVSPPREDRESERRKFMRETGFITESEQKLFAAVYGIVSAEGVHKLIAEKETISVLETIVRAYILLLLKRLQAFTPHS